MSIDKWQGRDLSAVQSVFSVLDHPTSQWGMIPVPKKLTVREPVCVLHLATKRGITCNPQCERHARETQSERKAPQKRQMDY